MSKPMDILMIGTGEYTTGYVGGRASTSDKGAGIIALSLFELRRQGVVGRIGMCGTTGTKFPGIRAHFLSAIGEKYPKSAFDLSMSTYPADTVERDPLAYISALEDFHPDAVTIFTPDDTHFDIAMAAVQRGIHVLVTKPAVKTLSHHGKLLEAAKENGALVMVEVHKRFDPIYSDAKDRIDNLGDFGYLSSYMSQPRKQLDTFRHWAGRARPVRVTAQGSRGVASAAPFDLDTEDTITLLVQWENRAHSDHPPSIGHAVYTASWVAPRSDVHSQQHFHYMGHGGELHVDQAHRGYSQATHDAGYMSNNPLFMKYTPSDGTFAGQQGYGFRSIESFCVAARRIRNGYASASDCDSTLPTIGTTMQVTAILEAGRLSLDHGNVPVTIIYGDYRVGGYVTPTMLRIEH